MDDEIDQGMVVEALLLLAEIDPDLARTIYLHKVEGQTELEVAEASGKSERHIRRWLNGYSRGKQYVWGAIDWMTSILALFREAQRYCSYSDVIFALSFAVGRNPAREPFTVAMLDMLWEAMDCRQLEQFLSVLEQARRDKEKYGQERPRPSAGEAASHGPDLTALRNTVPDL